MRSLLLHLSAAVMLLLAPVGCGSDSDGGDSSSPSSTSAGTGGSSSTTTTGSGGSTTTTTTTTTGTGGTAATTGTGGATTGTGGDTGEPTVSATIDPTTIAAGDNATVTIEVTNFILEAPTGQPDLDGHGHYHIYLDDATGGDYLAPGQTETKVIKIPANTDPGAHTIRVSLGENNHAPLSPPVETILDITVE